MINAAGNTAIMNERGSDSYTDLIDKAVESIEYGYDFTVLVTRKPLEASIEANRTNKLRAVVCRSQEDASRARKARANLIIMDDDEFSKTAASGIMRGWLGSVPESAYEEEEPEQSMGVTEMGRSVFGILNSGVSMLKRPSRPRAKAERESKAEDDEVEDIKKPKGGGIIKNIKYVFGLE